MSKKLRALQDNIIVKELENYEQPSIIQVDLTDKRSLRGLVLSVGDDVEHIVEGDVIAFTDSVMIIEDIYDHPVFLMKEDAIYCREV